MTQHTVLHIEGMSCQHCVRAVDEALRSVAGVTVEQVEIGSATVQADPGAVEAALVAVSEAGYTPAIGAPGD